MYSATLIHSTYSPCFCSGCSQAAVAHIMTLESSCMIIKLLKVHHLLHLDQQMTQCQAKCNSDESGIHCEKCCQINPLTRFLYASPSKVSCLRPMRVTLEKMLRSSRSWSNNRPVSPEAPRIKQLLFCCLKFSSRVLMSSAMLCATTNQPLC